MKASPDELEFSLHLWQWSRQGSKLSWCFCVFIKCTSQFMQVLLVRIFLQFLGPNHENFFRNVTDATLNKKLLQYSCFNRYHTTRNN